MNLTKNLTTFFNDTKSIYINIALVLGLIMIFIILPFPIPKYLSTIAKYIIIIALIYLLTENFKVNIKLIKNTDNNTDDQTTIRNTLMLSSIVNLLLIILIIYVWYVIFF